jgi:hypothetical protein
MADDNTPQTGNVSPPPPPPGFVPVAASAIPPPPPGFTPVPKLTPEKIPPPPIEPGEPGFFERAYETSGLKGMVDQAKAKGDQNEAVQKEVSANVRAGKYGHAAELILKHIAGGAWEGLKGPPGEIIESAVKGAVSHGKEAVSAAQKGNVNSAIENAAEAVPIIGQLGEQIVKPLATDVGGGNLSGAAGDIVGGGAQLLAAKGLGKLAGMGEGAATGPGVTAEETIPKAEPLKTAGEAIKTEIERQKPSGTYPHTPEESQTVLREANPSVTNPKEVGQKIQQNAQGVRDAKGKAVGAAKEEVAQKLPLRPASPLPKGGKLSTKAEEILKESESANQLAGAKDPDMADVQAMADHLFKGKNANGEPLSADPAQADAINRAFKAKIEQLQSKADAGGNATALRHVKDLKAAYQDDLYDAYEAHGDPAAAQALRDASKEYAKTVSEQTFGPAKAIFKNSSPEKIVSNIVSGGTKAQSAVESVLRNGGNDSQTALRDGVKQEILRRATKADGTIDAGKASTSLANMGETGKLIFGDEHKSFSTMLNEAAKAGRPVESVFSPKQTENPERIVYDLVNGGPAAQTTAETYMKRLSSTNQAVLRDSALKEVYRQNTLPDGTIDMTKARKAVYGMGDTAKTLWGNNLKNTTDFLDAAAKEQESRIAKATKPTIAQKMTPRLSRAAGAGIGATVGGVPGAIVGEVTGGELGEALVGKSGAVKIGISPTEKITMSPAQVSSNLPAITKFFKAKAQGNAAAMAGAYSSISGQKNPQKEGL